MTWRSGEVSEVDESMRIPTEIMEGRQLKD